MTSNISIIGLGKLGASMAGAFAHKGFSVIGVDVNKQSVDRVNDGRAPVQETDLDNLIAGNRDRIRATLSHEEAVIGSDVSFVIVPTPSDEKGSFSLQYAEWAFAQIGKAIRKKQSYHLIVLTSTVLPGATRHGLLPILERESGKKVGRDFGLCYSPEFIALGSIIRDFLNPDFSLIGEFDERSGSMLASIYERLVDNGAPAARMSPENAELTKISVNTFVTTKITFANMLASICEQLPGGDVDVVTSALGLDSRIGKKYLTGAIGYGGPCFPRDNVALSYIAGELGVNSQLAETTDSLNRATGERIAEEITREVPAGSTVAVLGLAYKPFSQVTEESQGVQIAEHLSRRGLRVVAFDPLSSDMAVPEHGWSFLVLDSLQDCLQQAQSVVITTPDPVFAALSEDHFSNEWTTVKVFDLWRILRGALEVPEGSIIAVPDSVTMVQRRRKDLKIYGRVRMPRSRRAEMKVRVAVVTPIHNRREITIQCLRSLARVSRDSIDVNVYVVDDGSTDGSSEAIRAEFPQVTLIEGNGELWYTEGSNVGIRAALETSPDFVLAINDDSVFDTEFLRYLLETAERHPRSVVGPLLLLWDEPHKLFQTAPVWSTLEGGWKHWRDQTVWTVPTTAWEVDLIVGNCVLYPASVFAECGFMDSRRFPNFGDAEFTPRLKRAGYRLIIDPRSRVFCQPNETRRRLREGNPFRVMRNLVLDLKHPSNLTRLFLSHISGGPSVLKGITAWFVFVGNTLLNLSRSTTPDQTRPEPPLSEVFAEYVLNRK